MAGGYDPDGIHITGNAGVVHRHNGAGARRDQRLNGGGVDVGIEGGAVGKHDFGPAQHEGIRRRHESVRRHDDFIAGLQIEQDGSHFERIGAAGGQQHFVKTKPLLKKLVAALGEQAVAGNLAGTDGFFDVSSFLARQVRLVERDGRGNSHRK